MREIKFRAWDNLNKEWLNPKSVALDGIGESWNLLNGTATGQRQNGVWHFMQYTGLKDKNGKEIYEGDIIRCDACDGQIYEIKWYDGRSAKTKEALIGQMGWNLVANEAEQTEVIGNIYQDKDLLK